MSNGDDNRVELHVKSILDPPFTPEGNCGERDDERRYVKVTGDKVVDLEQFMQMPVGAEELTPEDITILREHLEELGEGVEARWVFAQFEKSVVAVYVWGIHPDWPDDYKEALFDLATAREEWGMTLDFGEMVGEGERQELYEAEVRPALDRKAALEEEYGIEPPEGIFTAF